MTHPSGEKKLTDNEIYSINNAVKDAGIQQVHPEKMEAFAGWMVERLKEKPSAIDSAKNSGEIY